jgi:hypothetical protein
MKISTDESPANLGADTIFYTNPAGIRNFHKYLKSDGSNVQCSDKMTLTLDTCYYFEFAARDWAGTDYSSVGVEYFEPNPESAVLHPNNRIAETQYLKIHNASAVFEKIVIYSLDKSSGNYYIYAWRQNAEDD